MLVFRSLPHLDPLQQRDHLLPKLQKPSKLYIEERNDLLSPLPQSCSHCSKEFPSLDEFSICWNCHDHMCIDCFRKHKRQVKRELRKKGIESEIVPCVKCEMDHSVVSVPYFQKRQTAFDIFRNSSPADEEVKEFPPEKEKELIGDAVAAQVNQCIEVAQQLWEGAPKEEEEEMKHARRQVIGAHCTHGLQGLHWLYNYDPQRVLRSPDFRPTYFRAHYLRSLAEGSQDLSKSIEEAFPDILYPPKLYLDNNSLPSDLKPEFLHRHFHLFPSHEAFYRLGGIHSGLTRFTALENLREAPQAVNYLNDLRWVFPSSSSAQEFHKECLIANSEGAEEIPVQDSHRVGSDCHIFRSNANHRISNFLYLFQLDNVVVKLYLARFDLQHKQFDIQTASELASKAAELSKQYPLQAHQWTEK